MHGVTVRSQRYECVKPLKLRISDYMRKNVYVTSSGFGSEAAVRFAQQELGVDRVLYAMDYPYEYEADEVRAMDRMSIPDADKKKFFQTNAEQVFRL
jgi:2,3-dihydroxybenzoate decarboxylase